MDIVVGLAPMPIGLPILSYMLVAVLCFIYFIFLMYDCELSLLFSLSIVVPYSSLHFAFIHYLFLCLLL